MISYPAIHSQELYLSATHLYQGIDQKHEECEELYPTHLPPHSFELSHKVGVVEDVLRITVASCLGRPAGDDHPDIVPLATLDRIVQLLDALVRQIPVRGVVRPALCVRVPVVPEDPHQADQVGQGELQLKVEAIVALEEVRPPVDSVEGNRLTRVKLDPSTLNLAGRLVRLSSPS